MVRKDPTIWSIGATEGTKLDFSYVQLVASMHQNGVRWLVRPTDALQDQIPVRVIDQEEVEVQETAAAATEEEEAAAAATQEVDQEEVVDGQYEAAAAAAANEAIDQEEVDIQETAAAAEEEEAAAAEEEEAAETSV